jgi:hypothetical protein
MNMWDKQPAESAAAFEAFRAYRDLDPSERSIKRAAEAVFADKIRDRDAIRFGRWSSKFGWVRRAEAWDAERDRQAQEAEIEVIREMRTMQASTARNLQRIADESLERYAREMETDPEKKLNPALILQFATQGAAMERTVRGEPTEILGQTGSDRQVIQVEWGAPTHEDEPEVPGDGNDAVHASGTNGGNQK